MIFGGTMKFGGYLVLLICLYFSAKVMSYVRASAADWLDALLVSHIERGGPLVIKAAQLMSIQGKIGTPTLKRKIVALRDSTKHDSLESLMSAHCIESTPLGKWSVEHEPIGCGALGQLHIAKLSGRRLAVKFLRPHAVRCLQIQLATLRLVTERISRVRIFANLPMMEAVEGACTLFGEQMDLEREGQNYIKLRRIFENVPFVRVPRVYPELSSKSCLALEVLDNLKPVTDAYDTRKERERLAERVLKIVVKMIFWDGLVHCDLHPGNLLVDDRGNLIILDCGLLASISDATKSNFTRFFRSFISNDGAGCANMILETATARSRPKSEALFRVALERHVAAAQVQAAECFNIGGFITGIFALTARYGIRCSTEFSSVLLALAFVDQVIIALAPQMDFQARMRSALGPSTTAADHQTSARH